MEQNNSSQIINSTFKPFISSDKGYKRAYPYYKDLEMELKPIQPDSFDVTKSKKKKSKTGIIAISTTAAVAAAGFFIAVMSGRTQNISKNVKSLLNTVADKASSDEVYKATAKIGIALDKAGKIATNITPIKDYAFAKLMSTTAVTKKLWTNITDTYTKINKNVVIKHHNKAIGSYDSFINEVEKNIRLTKLQDPDTARTKAFNLLENMVIKAKSSATDRKFFTNFEVRYGKMMKNDMRTLKIEIDKKDVLSKKFYTEDLSSGLITENAIMDGRAKYAKSAFEVKHNLSQSYTDLTSLAKSELRHTDELIYAIKDRDAQSALVSSSRKLRSSLNDLDKTSKIKLAKKGSNPEKGVFATREEKIDTLNTKVINIQNSITEYQEALQKINGKTDILSTAKYSKIKNQLNEFEEYFKTDSLGRLNQGTLQNIRRQVGEVWGHGSPIDVQIKSMGDAAEKDLRKAISSELKMYDKQRDLTVGAGPTDVLGLVAPIALFGYALQKDKTQEERVGTTLKTGVPIIGATGAYLWSVARQFNGGPALMFSLGTAAVLNFIGDSIFHKYKHSVGPENKEDAVQNPRPIDIRKQM